VTRVAILGANGQVGLEVTLLLSRIEGIEAIPVCRNPLGSAFLRSRGVRCRHGSVADPRQAPRLIGDADVVLNFALALGKPRASRLANDAIIENAAAASRAGSRVVFFSTMTVYGDPRYGRLPIRSAYGREKRHGEGVARRAGRRHRRPTWSLRLGHVCGDLQTITADIRAEIALGPVSLPRGGAYVSNTVYTATIVDAVLAIVAGREAEGTYDLMCSPPWTWREVFAFEAARIRRPLTVIEVPGPSGFSLAASVARALRRGAGAVAGAPRVREWSRSVLARLPERYSERAQSALHVRRAATEIADLLRPDPPPDHYAWRPQGRRWLKTLKPTLSALSTWPGPDDWGRVGEPFPADLPDPVGG